jgi:hypothetical protein
MSALALRMSVAPYSLALSMAGSIAIGPPVFSAVLSMTVLAHRRAAIRFAQGASRKGEQPLSLTAGAAWFRSREIRSKCALVQVDHRRT